MRHAPIYWLIFLWLIGFACTPTAPEEVIPELPPYGEFVDDWTFKVNVGPQSSGYNFDIAEFRLWVPEGPQDLKAILVLASSHNSNGLGLVGIEAWTEFAETERVALLGIHFKTYPGRNLYTSAGEGSGQALLRSLDSITQKQNLSGIAELPFLMRGYSAGGVFGYQFSAFKPERVLAFANIRGGSLSETPAANNGIPGLMLMGEHDASRNERIQQIVLDKRSEGGLWAFALEPEVDHFGGLTPSDELIRSFFARVLAKRDIAGSNELAPINEATGWLGNPISLHIHSFDEYPDLKTEAPWLIDAAFAQQWKQYQQ